MSMVDISDKPDVPREAVAQGKIILSPTTVDAVKKGEIKKGDVLESAKVAGMQAVKDTPRILPHCHPVNITAIEFEFILLETGIVATCLVKANYKTGVEMDALTGTAVALLTIWDMVKYLEKDQDGQYPETVIQDLRVVKKVKGV